MLEDNRGRCGRERGLRSYPVAPASTNPLCSSCPLWP